jgi:hypothetical protein
VKLKRLHIVWAIASLLFLSFSSGESSFKVVGDKSMKMVLSLNQKIELAEMKIQNLSDRPISLVWTRIDNTLKSGWDYSMCAYGKCQIGIPTTGVLSKILPGKTGFIAIHLFPKGVTGNGKVAFSLHDKYHPEFNEKVEFIVEVN